MAAYGKTWNTDSPAYNYFGERAMEKVEAQAAQMWLVGDRTTPRVNSSWGDRKASRALDTTYTNGARHRLIAVSLTCDADGANPADARLQTGNPLVERGRVSSRTFTDTSPLFWIVQPNEDYRVLKVISGAATVTIEHWYEFDFDGVHTAQTYDIAEVPTTSKLNKYAEAVNDLAGAESSPAYGAAAAKDVEGTIGATATLVLYSVRATDAILTSRARIQQGNNGGALTDVGLLELGAVTNSRTRQLAVMVNSGGKYKLVTVAGTIEVVFSSTIPMVVRTPITFTDGEGPGTATGDKFRDLDANAARAVNTTIDWTRTQRANDGAQVTPSTTRWSIAVVWVELQPQVAADGVAEIITGGLDVRARALNTLNTTNTDAMLIALVPPNVSYEVALTNAVVKSRYDWVVTS